MHFMDFMGAAMRDAIDTLIASLKIIAAKR